MNKKEYIHISVFKEEKSWTLKDCKIGFKKDGIKKIETPDGHLISLVDTVSIMGDIVKCIQITRKDNKVVTLTYKQFDEINEMSKKYFKEEMSEWNTT